MLNPQDGSRPGSGLLVVQHGVAVVEGAPLDVLPGQAHRVGPKVEAQEGVLLRPCCTAKSQPGDAGTGPCGKLVKYTSCLWVEVAHCEQISDKVRSLHAK